jgi:hypothetical protein
MITPHLALGVEGKWGDGLLRGNQLSCIREFGGLCFADDDIRRRKSRSALCVLGPCGVDHMEGDMDGSSRLETIMDWAVLRCNSEKCVNFEREERN